MIVHAFWIQQHDLLELLNSQFQDFLGLCSLLQIAEGTQIDPSQQPARFQVLGIALDDLLRFQHSVADASGARVKFCQASVQKGRIGVIFQRLFVFLDGLAGKLRTGVVGNQFLVNVAQRVVIVGLGLIRLYRRFGFRCFGFWLGLGRGFGLGVLRLRRGRLRILAECED